MNDTEKKALRRYQVTSFWAATAHYMECESRQTRSKWFGLLSLISSIAVLFFANSEVAAIGVVATLEKLLPAWFNGTLESIGQSVRGSRIPSSEEPWLNALKFLVSMAGLATVLFTTVHQVRNYKELAWRHKIAAVDFSNIRRKSERYAATYAESPLPPHVLHTLSKEYYYVSRSSPTVRPKTIYFLRNPKTPKIVRLAIWLSSFFANPYNHFVATDNPDNIK